MTLLTVARNLRRRRGRERQGRFVAEGVRAVEDLLRSPIAPLGILVDASAAEQTRVREILREAAGRHVPVTRVSTNEFESAADTEAPQGVLAVASIPDRTLDDVELRPGAPLVVLDAVQDPGNAGTIIRTAAALAASAVVALPGTVDLWNAKVVRGGMGAHFHQPPVHCTTDELVAFLDARGAELWVSGADGEPLAAAKPPLLLAIAVGNEGAGVNAAVAARARRRVTIPLAPGIESLNAAVAAGILLYSLSS